jgi:predicted TIM-barrel fold metal-dependent hydrolase
MKHTQVIDSDGHVWEVNPIRDSQGRVVEIQEMWSAYLEERYRERRPRIIRDNWGHHHLLVEGRIYAHDPVDQGKHFDIFDHITGPGGFNPHARLKDMDQEGIDVAVLYGTFYLGLELVVKDVKFNAALNRAYNNWLADYCRADSKRLKGIANLPLVDIEESCKELRRAVKELGFVGVKMPPVVWGKMLDHPDFYPLYAEMQELDVPIGIHHHVGAGVDTPVLNYEKRFPIVQALCMPADNMLACACLIYGGVLDRFPRLRVAFLESGCSWVPYWMARLEQHTIFAQVGYDLSLMKKSVVDHMRGEQCYYHAESEEAVLPEVLRAMGEDLFMYASDYPHFGDAASMFGAVAEWREQERITESARRNILGKNAARFYRLDF